MMDEEKICQQFDQVVRQLRGQQRLAFNQFWQAFVDAHLADLMTKYDCTDVYELATHHPQVYREWIAQIKMALYRHGVDEQGWQHLSYDEAGNLHIQREQQTLMIPIEA
ncbi:hypothetical protein ACFFLI_09015 [Lactiplantibacillus modestisalitolerans]|uniref:Uncharacterized protein n=3 Tax=Lactiplantibacillus modestisalitolerans TaxID=1457219 RepID=A0ABV5WVH7_9LACO